MFKKYFANFLILLFTFYAFSGCAFPSNSTYSDSTFQGSHSIEEIVGPVDKCQKTAETRSGPGRIGNMQIEKDGACHPFKV